MGEYSAERQTFTVVVGTTVATIFGPVPPQYTARVYQANYGNPGQAGTVNAVGYLMINPLITGYSTMGTMSPSGSIADFAVVQGNTTQGESNAEQPLFEVPPGAFLVALASAGSLIIKGVYDYKLGRSV